MRLAKYFFHIRFEITDMRRVLLLFAALTFSISTHASLVIWELNAPLLFTNLTNGPGTATGSFAYDADTVMFTDIMLTTKGVSGSSTRSYDVFRGLAGGDLFFGQSGVAAGSEEFGLILDGITLSDLTNAGGSLTVSDNSLAAAEYGCISPCTPYGGLVLANWDGREIKDTLVGTPVATPVPGTLALLGLGLAGIGYRRRKRR